MLNPCFQRLFEVLIWMLVIWLLPHEMLAARLAVSPIKLELTAKNPTTFLTIHNRGNEGAVLNLKAFAWQQENGKDIYTETHDILLAPPIISIPAQSSQVVRLALRKREINSPEHAYRVYLHEVPPPNNNDSPSFRIALRIGIPLFVAPTQPKVRQIAWQREKTKDGQLKITLTNKGNEHVKIAALKSLDEATQISIAKDEDHAAYLLPGQSHEWKLNVPNKSQDKLPLVAKTSWGELREKHA